MPVRLLQLSKISTMSNLYEQIEKLYIHWNTELSSHQQHYTPRIPTPTLFDK